MKTIPLGDYYRSASPEDDVADYRDELPIDPFVEDARAVAASLAGLRLHCLVALASGAGDVEAALRDEHFSGLPLVYVDSSGHYLEQARARADFDRAGDRTFDIDLFAGSGGTTLRRELDPEHRHLFMLLGGTFSNFPIGQCAALLSQAMSVDDLCLLDFGALIDTPAAVESRASRYQSVSRATQAFFAGGMRHHGLRPDCYELEVHCERQALPDELTYVTVARRKSQCDGDAAVELNRVRYYAGAPLIRSMESLGFLVVGGNVFDGRSASLLRRYLVVQRGPLACQGATQ